MLPSTTSTSTPLKNQVPTIRYQNFSLQLPSNNQKLSFPAIVNPKAKPSSTPKLKTFASNIDSNSLNKSKPSYNKKECLKQFISPPPKFCNKNRLKKNIKVPIPPPPPLPKTIPNGIAPKVNFVPSDTYSKVTPPNFDSQILKTNNKKSYQNSVLTATSTNTKQTSSLTCKTKSLEKTFPSETKVTSFPSDISTKVTSQVPIAVSVFMCA